MKVGLEWPVWFRCRSVIEPRLTQRLVCDLRVEPSATVWRRLGQGHLAATQHPRCAGKCWVALRLPNLRVKMSGGSAIRVHH